MNEDGLHYSKHCELQKRDADVTLEQCLKYLKCRNGDCIMDVGAAEGSVTLEVLLPKLPNNFKQLLLCDISPKLLQFAKNRTDDERIDTREMDIASSTIPDEFDQHFDHIFSFFCLNWIGDRTK
ncbi:hypothetical protein Zmor_009333 [Zophobas morio]|uniref:Methyltransferase type 12 domain-containing protein n=2 Tax=Zophobas morio TaxID=2755281 RepID=A0AA38IGL8_9CUCU|nr:hypothetical protein Zmor_009333 [Zophobas morio]